MAQTSIIINSTAPDGKTLQKTLTDVNGECGAQALKWFAKKLYGLTQNTYVKTTRIGKVVVDNESIPSAGMTQPITIGEFATVQPQFITGTGAKAYKASVSGAEGALACGCVRYHVADQGDEDFWTFGFVNYDNDELLVEFPTTPTGFDGFVAAGPRIVSGTNRDYQYIPTFVDFSHGDID